MPFGCPAYDVLSGGDQVVALAPNPATTGQVSTSVRPEASNGYWSLYNGKNPDGTVMGFVFGNQPAAGSGTLYEVAQWWVNPGWTGGDGLSPIAYLDIPTCSAGQVIDQSFILAPQLNRSADFQDYIETLVGEVPQPAVYPYGYQFTDDLSQIVPFLNGLHAYQGVATNQLGPYLQVR